MSENRIKGDFIFVPDDGTEAYEIDLNAILEDAASNISNSWWKKVTRFFQSFSSKKVEEETVAVQSVDLPEMVCAKLEELFSAAEWHLRDDLEGYSVACYILDVTPRTHEGGYEPMVTLTRPDGAVQDIALSDLLTHYVPYAPQERDTRYKH